MAVKSSVFRCASCKLSKRAPRRPGGWKAAPEGLLCDTCLHKRYVIRAVVLPIAECVGVEWADFCKRLHVAWRASTDLANWTIQEMFKRDTVPVGGGKLLPFPPGWCAYSHAKERFPAIAEWDRASQSMSTILRMAERKYLQSRFDVLVKRDTSLVTWKYPTPFPIRGDDWSASHGANNAPIVGLPFPGGKVSLRLERKADFGRQLGQFDDIVAGKAIPGEAAIYRHGRTGKILLKMVAWVPKPPPVGGRLHVCALHTDPRALLVAEIDGRQPWILNHDQLKRWLAVRESYLQRTSEDLKREKRMDPKQRKNLLKAREARLEKIRNRIDTALEQASAQVARFCERQDVAVVAYDDTDASFAARLPWFKLKTLVRRKLEERGVIVVCVGDKVSQKGKVIECLDSMSVRAAATATQRLLAQRRRTAAGRSHPCVSVPAMT